MTVFPVPAKITVSKSFRDLSGAEWIVLPEKADFPLKKRVMETAAGMKEKFLHTPRVCAGVPAGELLIVMQRKAGIPEEGYRLILGKTGPIRIEASDDAGFFYAMQTASQLLEQPKQTCCCTIHDKPSMRERGYMLDVSRNKVPTMDTVKAMVKSLAMLRYNSLQLYMEHTFAFSGHERVWAGYTPFTSEEIMELDAFCREYFVELVPNLNSFGHLERWLRHPQYKALAECDPPYINPDTGASVQGVLYPCKESLDFMDSLYREFLPNFTSRKINIGCDETWELGMGRSRNLCKKKGNTEVYLDFLSKLAERASKYGCSVEFWGDIIMHKPELISKLPPKITALEWGYEYNHPFERDTLLFRKSGIRFIVCPGTSAWNSILGRTTNMIGNIRNAVHYGCRNGAAGMLMTDWGDRGHHQYWPISWAGIAMGGGAAWNAEAEETASLLPQGISLAFAPGKEGVRMGEFLLECGRIYDDFSTRISNNTPFGWFMTAYDRIGKRSFPKPILCSDVGKAMKHAQKLLDQLASAPFTGFPLENAELENGLRMGLAAMVFLNRAVGGKWDRNTWRDSLLHVIARHEELWLARNRSGGLYESSTYLRKFMEKDPDAWKKR